MPQLLVFSYLLGMLLGVVWVLTLSQFSKDCLGWFTLYSTSFIWKSKHYIPAEHWFINSHSVSKFSGNVWTFWFNVRLCDSMVLKYVNFNPSN